jgi:hypothetical protein
MVPRFVVIQAVRLLLQLPGHCRADVIVQVGADARTVCQHSDTVPLQQLPRADTGQLQQLW